jgi:hypothetical protein
MAFRREVARLDMNWYQGSRYRHTLRVIDPTYTITSATMHVRRNKADETPLLVLDQTGDQLKLEPDGDDVLLKLDIPASTMAGLSFDRAYYDLEVVQDGDVEKTRKLLNGQIELTHEVTR